MTGNFPDGMTSSDWDHVEGVVRNPEPQETRVLRAVVFLTYHPTEDPDDDTIEEAWSPYNAEKDIDRALRGLPVQYGVTAKAGLPFRPDKIEVVDAQYMTEAEADA